MFGDSHGVERAIFIRVCVARASKPHKNALVCKGVHHGLPKDFGFIGQLNVCDIRVVVNPVDFATRGQIFQKVRVQGFHVGEIRVCVENFDGACKAKDTRRVFRAGAQRLLAAPVHKLLYVNAVFYPKRADAFWSADFVRGDCHGVKIKRNDVKGEFAKCLCRVAMDVRGGGFCADALHDGACVLQGAYVAVDQTEDRQ